LLCHEGFNKSGEVNETGVEKPVSDTPIEIKYNEKGEVSGLIVKLSAKT